MLGHHFPSVGLSAKNEMRARRVKSAALPDVEGGYRLSALAERTGTQKSHDHNSCREIPLAPDDGQGLPPQMEEDGYTLARPARRASVSSVG
jgi:hypothetical protein